MMRGMLKPNGYAQHHIAGVTIFAAGREFVVDGKQEELLIDKVGEPLRMSTRAYEHVKGEFGKALVCEPIGGDGEKAAQTIAELERQLFVALENRESDRRQFDASYRAATNEIERLGNRIDDLEQQLAAAKATAVPAAPVAEKPAKPAK